MINMDDDKSKQHSTAGNPRPQPMVRTLIPAEPRPSPEIKAPQNDYITEGFDLNRKKKP